MNHGHLNTRSSIAALGVGLLLLLTGCADKSFSTAGGDGTPGTSGTPVPGCTTQYVEDIYLKTKILFVVDTSGSNANGGINSQGDYVSATDPNKVNGFRYQAISAFVNQFRHKTNFSWGMNTFSNKTSVALINSNSSPQLPIFSDSPSAMDSALSTFINQMADYGDTPYGSALALAAKAVANDPDKNKTGNDKPTYFVIMLTDGFPTDYYQDVDSNGDGVIDQRDHGFTFQESQMKADVNALLAAAPGQVNLSTVFYGVENDPGAQDLLKKMAALGGGQYANVNVSSPAGFKIDDVIPGSSTCK